jgi:hypothetical protein
MSELRLVADNVRSYDWESYPRREPKPARERLRGLVPWRPTTREPAPAAQSNPPPA